MPPKQKPRHQFSPEDDALADRVWESIQRMEETLRNRFEIGPEWHDQIVANGENLLDMMKKPQATDGASPTPAR
jgi:hypothetical protein